MAGREKIKLYQFDLKNRKQKMWNCMQDIKNEYYNGTRFPMFQINPDYHALPDGTYVTKQRYTRDELAAIIKISNSVYVNDAKVKKDDKEIEVFNLANEKIAEYKNIRIASKLSTIPAGTIYSQLNKSKGKKSTLSELIFKYKQ